MQSDDNLFARVEHKNDLPRLTAVNLIRVGPSTLIRISGLHRSKRERGHSKAPKVPALLMLCEDWRTNADYFMNDIGSALIESIVTATTAFL